MKITRKARESGILTKVIFIMFLLNVKIITKVLKSTISFLLNMRKAQEKPEKVTF